MQGPGRVASCPCHRGMGGVEGTPLHGGLLGPVVLSTLRTPPSPGGPQRHWGGGETTCQNLPSPPSPSTPCPWGPAGSGPAPAPPAQKEQRCSFPPPRSPLSYAASVPSALGCSPCPAAAGVRLGGQGSPQGLGSCCGCCHPPGLAQPGSGAGSCLQAGLTCPWAACARLRGQGRVVPSCPPIPHAPHVLLPCGSGNRDFPG